MEDKKKWKRELSAGGVVYRRTPEGTDILVIQPKKRDSDEGSGKWTFPKGLVGDGQKESMQEAALREVREEGGVAAEIKEDLGGAKIFFKFGGENIFKTLHYYLMEYVSGGPEEHDWEVKEALWVPLAEVKGLLSYRSDKEMLVLAAKIIHAQNI